MPPKDPEKLRAYKLREQARHRRRYAAHPARECARRRQWYHDHLDYSRAYGRQYYHVRRRRRALHRRLCLALRQRCLHLARPPAPPLSIHSPET